MKTILTLLMIVVLCVCIEACGTVTNTQCDSIVSTFSTIAHALCVFVEAESATSNLSSQQSEVLKTTMLRDQVASLIITVQNYKYSVPSKSMSLNSASNLNYTISILDSLYVALESHLKYING